MISERDIETRDRVIKSRINKYEYGPHLYHYTSFASLYGILRKQELWLGSTASMNDALEIRDFIWRMRDALIQDLPSEKHFHCKRLFKEMDVRLDSEYPFAICFSDLEDNAAQWERYASDAQGVCIVFNTPCFMKLIYYQMPFNKVFYEYDIREHEHYKTLYRCFTTGERTDFPSEEGLIDNILACGYVHKHRSFITENESRAITLWGRTPPNSDVCYELINGQIRRVLKLHLEKMCEDQHIEFEQLIDKIVIGPRSKQNEYELREFVKQCHFSNLADRISTSQCPLI